MSAQEFSEEQRRYLEGFVSGVQARRASQGLKPLGTEGGGSAQPAGPDREHLAAMARFEAAGKKLSPEEKAKRDEHPFDAYARFKQESAKGLFPKGLDNFRWRFHGLFYLAPAQNSYMCRLRIANGILSHWQLAGVADLAEAHGGGYTHVTTRANLQIRDVMPEGAIPLLEGLVDLGITTKGTGADNIRNVTGSPTAGIDPQELLDTRPCARAWHHHILNDRSLYGLPRKFNVGFDGGGAIPVLEDTNDIAFTAVTVGEGAGVEPGVWFRLGIGGITGHQNFAKLGGVYVKPDEAVAVADAIVRVFIANGDRTDRKKARLKYVLDAWGLDKFLAEVEAKLGAKLARLADGKVSAPNRQDRSAHIGFHAQKQAGKVWAGVALPVGKLTCEQMRGLARIARELGDGDIRLTVWQNLILSGIDQSNAGLIETCLREIGLTAKATSVRAGLIACTGNTGCKFALSNTKDTAIAIADWVEPRVTLDSPINIHLTGCPNSCAQHYIGDVGLLACRVAIDEAGEDTVEGFHVFVGGGFGADAGIARELCRNVRKEDCPRFIERILAAYMRNRAGTEETFLAFTRRHELPALKAMVEAIPDWERRMSVQTKVVAADAMIPESAPFAPEQRAWLNGFFAGLLSLDAKAGAAALDGAMPDAAAKALLPEDDGAPWHDAAMPLPERMTLAEGKPLPRRLFAAMAQQDCGQCGYLCETYSAAIASGQEPKLNLCAPGGKETSRMLKRLLEEMPAAAGKPTAQAVAPAPETKAAEPGSRDAPIEAVFRSATRLNGGKSEKDTRHIVFDVGASGLAYAPGDSFGLYPKNDPALAEGVRRALGVPADFPIGDKTICDALIEDYALGLAPDALFGLIGLLVGGERRRKAKALAAGEDPDGDAATLDVLAALEKFAPVHADPEAFLECLEPLQPRLYSISSSPLATPGEVHLTVDAVRYEIAGRQRLGVASTLLADRLEPGAHLKAYIRKAHGFALPDSGSTPIIMVGPGTGVAPFRSFLLHRKATGAKGRAWLFFGHQHEAEDFFYRDELHALLAEGTLTRLSTAWSRDGAEKVYVQDRMRQAGPELWSWLRDGAHFYVCGDAKRMAGDVETALAEISAKAGQMSEAAARDFIAELKAAGRYQADVY